MADEPQYPRVLGIQYKWVAAVIVMIGTFMTLLDTTIVNITLPKMMAELNTDTFGVQWVVITYLIGAAISMTTVTWLGAKIGHKKTYIAGLLLFTLSSALCGQAWSLDSMNTARLIQGFGEGLVVTISLTILYEVFPEKEHGLAIGIYGLGASFAPAMGPTLGGLLTEHLSWRWIFYVNLPVGAIGLLLAIFMLRRSKPAGETVKAFDGVGFGIMVVWVSSLIVFLAKGQEWGWGYSDAIVALVALFVVSFPAYVLWELRTRSPLTQVRFFRFPTFALAITITLLFSMTMYGAFFLLPLYMERLRLYPTLTAGLVLLPGSIVMGVSVIVGGLLADRWDAKKTLFLGMVGLVLTTWHFSTLDLYTDKYVVALDFAIWAAMVGLIYPAATIIAFSVLKPHEINMGSSIQNATRLIAGSIGTSIAVTMLERRSDAFFDALSQKLTYASPALPAFSGKLPAYFARAGVDPATAQQKASALMEMHIQANATAYGFQSAFVYLAIFSVVGTVLVLGIKHRKRAGMKVALH